MKILKNNKKIIFPIHATPKGSGLSWGFFRKSLEDCTNPHFDCVNCPLRGYYRGYTTLTNNSL